VSRLIKQANRKSTSTTTNGLSANEARLSQAQATLVDRKRDLDSLDANRAGEVQAVIETSSQDRSADLRSDVLGHKVRRQWRQLERKDHSGMNGATPPRRKRAISRGFLH
jgi:hypothetical protein